MDGGSDSPNVYDPTPASSLTGHPAPERAGPSDNPTTPESESGKGAFVQGGLLDLDDPLNGSSSLVSSLLGTGLNVDASGNRGVNVSADGNDDFGTGVSADVTGDEGLNVDINGTGNQGLVGIGGIGDIGGLVGSSGSLIDIDVDQDDGQTAALLDVVGSSDGDAQAAMLGSDVIAGGSVDILDSSGLLDGILDDVSLLS